MNKSFPKPMSLMEFHAWEELQPLRYEFNGISPEAMSGGTAAHAIIQANLAFAMISRLRGTPCRFIGNDLKLNVGANSSRYSDGFVVCSKIDPKATVINDPVVIFEVLSPPNASKDRIVKNREYEETPSVKRYFMIEQDRIGVTVFSRDTGEWKGELVDKDPILRMPEVGVDVPISELYEGLEFDVATGIDDDSGSGLVDR
jgi:Uma2 family endonuclease